MLKNYLKIAFRNIIRHKGYSFINISGLAIGMACCILILLWVRNELNYDRYHEKGDQIYRVVQEADYTGQPVAMARTPFPLAKALDEEFPEIAAAGRWIKSGLAVKYQDKEFKEKGGCFVDPALLTIFTFQFVQGNPQNALENLHSVVVTEPTARRWFGEENPLGKTIQIDGQNVFEVSGVIKDVSAVSHWKFDFLVPFDILKEWNFPIDRMPWTNSNNALYTYVRLRENVPASAVNAKLSGLMARHSDEAKARFYLQPVQSIHLYSDLVGDIEGNGDIKYVYIFSVMALFILLIASINFMNLATARSARRAREVGIRKVVGAEKSRLVMQFLGEAVLLSFISLLFALFLIELLLPTFNYLSGKQLSLAVFENLSSVGILAAVALLTGILAGSYPAIYLSSFQPATVLKESRNPGRKSVLFRKVLVVFQFTLSILLIISSIVVYRQLDFMRNRGVGFDKEHLVYMHMDDKLQESYLSFKAELLKSPDILNVTTTGFELTNVAHAFSHISWEGMDPDAKITMNGMGVDHDFIKTMGMQVVAGRDFSREHSTDAGRAYIVNQEAVRQMGLKNAVGTRFSIGGTGEHDGRIIGVVKDFNFKPLRHKIEPLILLVSDREHYYVYLRVRPGGTQAALAHLEATAKNFAPGAEIGYRFFDVALQNVYQDEARVSELFRYFTLLAIFISCLGLLGLASFMTETRRKEIGIRKVFGASIRQVVLALTKEFVWLVLLANIVAWPLAYYFMSNWLQQFAYRIDMGLTVFIFAGILALLIAVLTVSYHAVKAAMANPVNALHYE